MSDYLVFMVAGVGTGAVYAALAMGLVVVHKGAGTINFAQGAMAMYAAYVFDEVRRAGDLVLPVGELPVGDNVWVALACGVGSAAGLGLVAHLAIFRPLRTAPPLAKVVASVGLMMAIQAVVVLRFSADARAVHGVLPNEVVRWGDVSFSRDRLYLAGLAVLIGVVLWAYFRFSRLGLATRAAAENEDAAALTGYSPSLLAGGAWVLASTVGGVVAILAAPATTLNPTNFMLFVVPALAVTLLARLDSLAVACAAGLALGALQSVIGQLVTESWWPEWAGVGVADAVPFVLIVVALFVFGRSLPDRGAVRVARLPTVVRSARRPLAAAVLVAAGGTAILLTGGSYRFAVIASMIFAILALSLVVLTGLVGQISLAQVALGGAAGFALSRLTTDAGVPFPLSLLLAALVATGLGVIVGIPALRIRGAQLAVVTLAGAVAIERFVFRNPYFTPASGNRIADPDLFGLDLAVRRGSELVRAQFGLVVLVTLVLAALAVGNLARSDTGRMFLAVRSNERAAAAAGINVASVKLVAFGFASFLAGIGGGLIGYSRGQLSAESFGVFVGLSMLAAAYLGGITSVSGALVAGLFAPLGVGYVLLDRNLDLGHYHQLIGGVALVVTAILNPSGIAGKVQAERARASADRARGRAQLATSVPSAGGSGR